MAGSTRFKEKYVRLPAPRHNLVEYARAIEQLVLDERCDVVLPTGEEVFFLAAARDLHGADIPVLAPAFSLLERMHNKFSFSQMATGYGANPPETTLLLSSEDVLRVSQQARLFVFKPVWSRFAERMLVCPPPKKLRKLAPSLADPWVAQEYLPGEEISCWAIARDGKVLALQAYRSIYRAGKGAGFAFEPLEDPAVRGFVTALCKATRWDGQVSFDFRRDAADELHVIECNPRATSGIHFFAAGDGLSNALFEGLSAKATIDSGVAMRLAMFLSALPLALRDRRFRRWKTDLTRMQDLSQCPGDRQLLPAQFLAMIEIVLTAIVKRRGLKAAATDDIEWDGEPLN